MPVAIRPTASDPFSTRAGRRLHFPLTPVAAPSATVMEARRPGTRLSPPEPPTLNFLVAVALGVKWRHGRQPGEPAHGVDGVALAASLLGCEGPPR